MRNSNKKLALAAAAVLGLSAATAAPALAGYTLTTLATFNGTNGNEPGGNLLLSGGTLYGTAGAGGGAHNDGTVFSVSIGGGNVTALATFNGTNGIDPNSSLALSGSTLYGMTYLGGADANPGTIFAVPVGGGNVTTLATFNNTTGAYPVGGVILSGSTLYGTVGTGGAASGYGTIFSMPVGSGNVTVLATFNLTNGAYPNSRVILSGSTLYGTTQSGGNLSVNSGYGDGAVFSEPVGGGNPTTLATFTGTNGTGPNSVIVSGSTLYGTTAGGGTYGDGIVYSVPLGGGNTTVLATFNSTNGKDPNGLVLSGSTLYGTTALGGANGNGTVFSVPIGGGNVTTLATFNGTNGQYPQAMILAGSTLYGTTQGGGANGDGTVFAVSGLVTAPTPVVSLTSTAPGAFGSSLGNLSITGSNGRYAGATKTFAASATGYVSTSAWNPTTDTEIYALDITDSAAGNLTSDLAALATQINGGNYTGFSITAGTTDPTAADYLTNLGPGGFNFFLTVTGSTLGTSADDFGFDLSQFSANSDVLTATGIAAVPEPASMSLLVLGGVGLLARRRRRHAAA